MNEPHKHMRRYIFDKVPASNLAAKYQIQPSQIYVVGRQPQSERGLRQPDGQRKRAPGDPQDQNIAALEAHVARLQATLLINNEASREIMKGEFQAR